MFISPKITYNTYITDTATIITSQFSVLFQLISVKRSLEVNLRTISCLYVFFIWIYLNLNSFLNQAQPSYLGYQEQKPSFKIQKPVMLNPIGKAAEEAERKRSVAWVHFNFF